MSSPREALNTELCRSLERTRFFSSRSFFRIFDASADVTRYFHAVSFLYPLKRSARNPSSVQSGRNEDSSPFFACSEDSERESFRTVFRGFSREKQSSVGFPALLLPPFDQSVLSRDPFSLWKLPEAALQNCELRSFPAFFPELSLPRRRFRRRGSCPE